MPAIQLSSAAREAIRDALITYCREELDHDIGRLEAVLMTDFLTEEIAPFYYNQGLYDAQRAIDARIDSLKDAVFDLEQPKGIL
ncbi:MAG: DUF2164 domain-containing protein [Bacteroidota bacterium]